MAALVVEKDVIWRYLPQLRRDAQHNTHVMFQASWLAQLAQSPAYAPLRVAALQGFVNNDALQMLAQDLQTWRPGPLCDARLPDIETLRAGAQAALHPSVARRQCAHAQRDGTLIVKVLICQLRNYGRNGVA